MPYANSEHMKINMMCQIKTYFLQCIKKKKTDVTLMGRFEETNIQTNLIIFW